MFKKDITPGSKSKLKSSTLRSLRATILSTYPLLTPHLDHILPKKASLDVYKLPDRVVLYALGSDPLFWQHMDDPLLPHLKLVHRYPDCWNRVAVDRGAVRFVLGGATLMAPGLTSKGGWLGEKDLEAGEVVAVGAEGKENACLVGVLKMGTKEMREKGKGVAVEGGTYLGDGLWRLGIEG